MKSFAEYLHEQALRRESPETRAWCSARHTVVREYFAGSATHEQLRQAIHGYDGFRLTTLTSPRTEEWSLLMAAFDVLLDDGPRLARLSHGQITTDEWLEATAPIEVRRREQKSYGF